MRKLAKEIIFLLWLLEDLSDLLGNEDGKPLSVNLGYQEFMDLRPQYAASSWRVQLNRLVKERLILKQVRDGKVVFRLTRLGQERVQQVFFQNLYSETTDIFSVILLKPQNGQKTLYSSAQRILAGEGYTRLFTGVYLKPGTVPYTDFLWRSLKKQGFLPLFTQIRAKEVRPASIGEILLNEDELFILQGQWLEFSNRMDGLLSKFQVRNTAESRDKEEIGAVVLSGLSVMEQWSHLLEGSLAPKPTLLTRLVHSRVLLQEYAGNIKNS